MLKIILTINLTLIIKYICIAIGKYIVFSNKVEVARLICNYTELTENNVKAICDMLNN